MSYLLLEIGDFEVRRGANVKAHCVDIVVS